MTPTYDTYTKPTCDLCVTSTPALTIYQTPTQHSSLLPEAPSLDRGHSWLWTLFLVRFHMYDPLLPPPLPPRFLSNLLHLPLCAFFFFFFPPLFLLQIRFQLFGWHLRRTKLMYAHRQIQRQTNSEPVQAHRKKALNPKEKKKRRKKKSLKNDRRPPSSISIHKHDRGSWIRVLFLHLNYLHLRSALARGDVSCGMRVDETPLCVSQHE